MNKNEKQILFEVQLNWMAETRGVLSANDAAGTLTVATPPAFGGVGNPWTPEHFFLSAVSSCYMTTFLSFCRKFNFSISDFSCDSIGHVELTEGRYKITTIHLYPKIYIDDESFRLKASQALEKTHKYCLITNSISSDVFCHTEILLADEARNKIIADSIDRKD